MRYIGNKTRLLTFIKRVLRDRDIRGGTAVDPFSGTASVARALKRWGFAVVASDLMEYAHVFGKAYVEAVAPPSPGDLPPLNQRLARSMSEVIKHLQSLEPRHGFIVENFTPAGQIGAAHGRMYFTPENAGRVDAIREQLHAWHSSNVIGKDAYYIALAALIEAADRVANTTGVYAACVKSWQPNAKRKLTLATKPVIRGNGCHSHRMDAIDSVIRAGDFELLYLDPPYNSRQYPGYYHIPELIASGWFDGDIVLRGKTGLLPDDDKRSAWCSKRGAVKSLETLLENARCNHIVMSYNAEGILPEPEIERLLKFYGRSETYRRYARGYRRYRSDSDRQGRTYSGDTVREFLYCVSR